MVAAAHGHNSGGAGRTGGQKAEDVAGCAFRLVRQRWGILG